MKSKSRVKKTGEVFTPRSLIREMLDKLPRDVWFDPLKTWFEPSAGDGNFLVEIKARLLQAGHTEKHILENMLFSVELIDDNHWALQHRLGYLIDGNPNPVLNPDNFVISKIHPLSQDLNDKNPYHEKLGLERDEVLHHRNHICWSGLEYDMSFGRTEEQQRLDAEIRKLLGSKIAVTVTSEDIARAVTRSQKFTDRPDRPDRPRTPNKKIADTLMEIAELPFIRQGLKRAEGFQDIDAIACSIFPGIIEVKTIRPGARSASIECQQAYKFMLVLEQLTSTTELEQCIDEFGVDALCGLVLEFSLREVFEFYNSARTPFMSCPTVCDLGEWPETDTPDIGERYVVEKMLGSQESAKKIAPAYSKPPKAPQAKVAKTVKAVKSKEPKALTQKQAGNGGWSINPKFYGQGKILRSFFEGRWWIAKHDDIVDEVNVSLKAKGKPSLFEEAKYIKNGFHSSKGLRGGDKYWTLEK